jgi:hypothetical protein
MVTKLLRHLEQVQPSATATASGKAA